MAGRRLVLVGSLLLMAVALTGVPSSGVEPTKPAPSPPPAPTPSPPPAPTPTPPPPPPKVELILREATTSGTVGETVAKLSLKLGFEALTRKLQEIPLLPGDVSVTEFKFDRGRSSDVQLVRTDAGYALRNERSGENVAEVHYVARVEKAEKTRSLTLPLIPAAKAIFQIILPGDSVDVAISPATSFETAPKGNDTLLTLYGATADRVTITWKPKIEPKKVEAVVFADQNARVTVGRGVLRVETTLDYSILQGKVKQFTIALPADATLLSVKGEGVRTWDIAGQDKEKSLTVQLLDEVATSYKLELQIEQAIGKGALGEAAGFTVPAIAAKNVERETGAVAIVVWKGLKVEPAKAEGVTQVDVRELPAAFQALKDQVNLAYRYLQRPIQIEGKVSEVEAKVWADILTAVRVSPETLRLSSQVSYVIKDAGIFRLRLKLGKDVKLVDLQGENINNWEKQGDVLNVDLRSKAEGAYSLTLDTEQAVPPAAGGAAAQRVEVEIPTIELMEVTRQRGYIALAAAAGIKIEPTNVENIMQIDVGDVPRGPVTANLAQSQVPGQPRDALPDLAFRYLQPGYKLRIALSKIEAEVSAAVQTTMTVNEKNADVAAAVQYDIRKTGIFQLCVALPKGFKLLGCEGPNMDDWKEAADGKLTVALKQKTQGAYTLRLTGKMDIEKLAEVAIPVFKVVGSQKETGFVAVRADESLRLKSGKDLKSLVEIDVKELPPELQQGKVLLAYKYFAQPWSGTVAAEPIEPHVTAETFSFLSLSEALLQASVTVKYTILYAGVQSFKIQVPKDATNVDITGQDIKQRDEDKKSGIWTVTLQAKRKDECRLFVTFQQELSGKTIDLKYAGLEVKDVKRETGYITMAARSDLELAAGDDLKGLTPIDPQEIPSDYRIGIDAPLLLAFRYLKHPYTLHAVATRHDPADVLVAVIEACLLSTTLTEDGHLITDMTCRLRNTREQNLAIELPPGAELWHVFVDGRRAMPVQSKEGATLWTKVPIAGVGDGQRPLVVNLRYGSKIKALEGEGSLELDFPRMAIPALRLGWRLSLPEKYRLVSHNGSLRVVDLLDSELQALVSLPISVPGRPEPVRSEATPLDADQRAQQDYNRQALDQLKQVASSVREGRAGGTRSMYTGLKPETHNIYCFQSLIAMKEPGSIRSTYLRASLDSVFQGALVVAAVVGVLAFWSLLARFGWLWRAAVVIAAALVVLGLRTLWEEAYHQHLTDVLWALLLTLAAVILWDAGRGVGRWVRRPRASVEPSSAAPAPEPEAPPEPQPPAEAPAEEGS